jgi:hypothetical protein
MSNATYNQLRPIRAKLQTSKQKQLGPVMIEDTVQSGSPANTIRRRRRFLIDGNPVDLLSAARAVFNTQQPLV